MAEQSKDRIDELQAVVAALGDTLAASEHRSARLERTIRWGLMGILGAIGLTGALILNPFRDAIATDGQQASQSIEQAVDRLTVSLTGPQSTLGMMGQMMNAGVKAAVAESVNAIENDITDTPLYKFSYDSLYAYLRDVKHVPEQDIDVDRIKAIQQETKEQVMMFAMMTAAGSVMVDAGVLMHRIREDSNYFRKVLDSIGGPDALLAGIRDELARMNLALASVPIMAAEMNTMTHQMGVMSYSVGNTMGRASNWMPW